MGIETRKGKLYYYQKRREGGRVVSEYIGSGELASIAEHRAKKQRAEREQARIARLSVEQLSQEVDRACDLIDVTVKALLMNEGFYQHKGQWRKRGNGRKS